MEGAQFTSGPVSRPLSEERLLERLLEDKLLEQQDCVRARATASHRHSTLCPVLLDLGLIPERLLSATISEEFQIRCVKPDEYPLTPILDEEISAAFLKRYRVLPILLDERRIEIASADPFNDFPRKSFELMTGLSAEYVVATPSEIDEAIQRLYGAGRSSLDEIVDDIRAEGKVSEPDAQRLSDMASEAPIVRLVNMMIAKSVDAGASDIHFETYENRLLIRYRIDGVLHDLEAPPQHAAPAITSRIKIMAKLNIAERRLPQDGRIRLLVKGKTIDFRVSIVPALHGERIVMRILDRGSTPKTFDALGLSPSILNSLDQVLQKPNGMFLVTGPTGSGKTTTLYAALMNLPSKEKNILTVEDPIEYQLQNISQIQVKPQIGLTFANILRSILRQDPDIILIGEIRDNETADIAVHAALTGHLVLSTLHTNTAAGCMARLLDMGIEDYLLTTAIEGVLAQRLVRRLCPACKQPLEVTRGMRSEFDLGRFEFGDKANVIFRPNGCVKCSGTGYSGRSAIAEFLIPDEGVRQLVMRHAPAQEIHAAAIRGGMVPMMEDGLRMVAAGITTLDEVRHAVANQQ